MRFHLPTVAAAFALTGVFVAPATAQDADAMKANFEKKLASDFMKKVNWMTDFDAAKAKAQKSGEVIFAYFTRSYSP